MSKNQLSASFAAADALLDNELVREIARGRILQFSEAAALLPDVCTTQESLNDLMPLKHHFAPGTYAREIFIPKGVWVVGAIHRHAHMNIIAAGICAVFTEFAGTERFVAPHTFVSKVGTKRIVLAIEDTIWLTVHENHDNETDTDKLVDRLTAPSYDALLSVESELVLLLAEG